MDESFMQQGPQSMRDQMADNVEIELPEPTEDDVAQVRALIAQLREKGY